MLGARVWGGGQSGTAVKDRGYHELVLEYGGLKRSVFRPRCSGNERARTQLLFLFFVLFYHWNYCLYGL